MDEMTSSDAHPPLSACVQDPVTSGDGDGVDPVTLATLVLPGPKDNWHAFLAVDGGDPDQTLRRLRAEARHHTGPGTAIIDPDVTASEHKPRGPSYAACPQMFACEGHCPHRVRRRCHDGDDRLLCVWHRALVRRMRRLEGRWPNIAIPPDTPDMPLLGVVYLIVFQIGGIALVYAGQTTRTADKRIREHRWATTPVGRLIRSGVPRTVRVQPVHGHDPSILNTAEQQAIKAIDPAERLNQDPDPITPEARRQIARAVKAARRPAQGTLL